MYVCIYIILMNFLLIQGNQSDGGVSVCLLTEAMRRPEESTWQELTWLRWPCHLCTGAEEDEEEEGDGDAGCINRRQRSHSCTSWSSPHVTSHLPSPLTHMLQTPRDDQKPIFGLMDAALNI